MKDKASDQMMEKPITSALKIGLPLTSQKLKMQLHQSLFPKTRGKISQQFRRPLKLVKLLLATHFASEQGLHAMLKHNAIPWLISSSFSFEAKSWKKFAIGQMQRDCYLQSKPNRL